MSNFSMALHSLQHDTLADVIDRLKQLERSRNHEGSPTN